jgi:hypothetical protein
MPTLPRAASEAERQAVEDAVDAWVAASCTWADPERSRWCPQE